MYCATMKSFQAILYYDKTQLTYTSQNKSEKASMPNSVTVSFKIWTKKLPFGPYAVRVVWASSLQACMFLYTASSNPEKCCENKFLVRLTVKQVFSSSVKFGGWGSNNTCLTGLLRQPSKVYVCKVWCLVIVSDPYICSRVE